MASYLADKRRARDRLTADQASNIPPTNAAILLTLRGIDRSFRAPPGSARLQMSSCSSFPKTNISRIDQATVRVCTGSRSVPSSKPPALATPLGITAGPPARRSASSGIDAARLYTWRRFAPGAVRVRRVRSERAAGLRPTCCLGLPAYILGAGSGRPMLRAFRPSPGIGESCRRRRQGLPEIMHFIQVVRP